MESKRTVMKPLIFYVDDESDALIALKAGLEDRGYSVETAQTGELALEWLSRNQPSLILVDLRMQPMNGFEIFQKIRKNPQMAKTPVFFLTAVDDSLAKKFGKTLGVNAYITKPIDLTSLDSLIKEHLARK
jgi:two-component system NtrC family sensor kinase